MKMNEKLVLNPPRVSGSLHKGEETLSCDDSGLIVQSVSINGIAFHNARTLVEVSELLGLNSPNDVIALWAIARDPEWDSDGNPR